ncbi:MAG: hypothetical protein WA908_05635 [Pontixanthobacter sp.]
MVDISCSFSSPHASSAPSAQQLASSVPIDAELAMAPTLQEVFAAAGDAAAVGFMLSQIAAENSGPLLWVQDRQSIRDMGRVFLHGMPRNSAISTQPGASPQPSASPRQNIVHVAAKDGRETLWAMAEGLKCAALGAVIGELHGDPRALDFTATRRLAVAAERYGVPVFLMRVNGHADLSGARRRWRVESRPSRPHRYDTLAPGSPVWSLDLFRARDMQPNVWEASYDPAASRTEARTKNRLDLVPANGAGPVEEKVRRAG